MCLFLTLKCWRGAGECWDEALVRWEKKTLNICFDITLVDGILTKAWIHRTISLQHVGWQKHNIHQQDSVYSRSVPTNVLFCYDFCQIWLEQASPPFSWLPGWQVKGRAPSKTCCPRKAPVTTPAPRWKVQIFSSWSTWSSHTIKVKRSEKKQLGAVACTKTIWYIKMWGTISILIQQMFLYNSDWRTI